MNWFPAVRLSPVDRKEVRAQEQQDRLWFRMYPDRSLYLRPLSRIEREILGWPNDGSHYVVILAKDLSGDLHGYPAVDDEYIYDMPGAAEEDMWLLAALESRNRKRQMIGKLPISPTEAIFRLIVQRKEIRSAARPKLKRF